MTEQGSGAGAESDGAPTPVVLINTFDVKPGKLDAFLVAQAAELRRLAEKSPPKGWRGSRLHRSLEDDKAVMVTVFDTIEDHKRWIQTGGFRHHMNVIEDLLVDAGPGYFEIVAEAGSL